MTNPNYIQFTPGEQVGHTVFNPAESLSAAELTVLLRTICNRGLTVKQQRELGDQLDAIVPALIELRDAGHMELNMTTIVKNASREGFWNLACDSRLSPTVRQRCKAMHDKILMQDVQALLGHQ